jgi:hypothetical protein
VEHEAYHTCLLLLCVPDVVCRHRMLLQLYIHQVQLVLENFPFFFLMLQGNRMQKTVTELCGALSTLRSSGSVRTLHGLLKGTGICLDLQQ